MSQEKGLHTDLANCTGFSLCCDAYGMVLVVLMV